MRRRYMSDGMTIIEVIVAIAILAILGASLVGVLPLLSSNTQTSTVDATQSQRVFEVFERIASDWSNITAWNNETISVGGPVDVVVHVDALFGEACSANVQEVEAGVRKRVIITCLGTGSLPTRELRAEFGNPFGDPDE